MPVAKGTASQEGDAVSFAGEPLPCSRSSVSDSRVQSASSVVKTGKKSPPYFYANLDHDDERKIRVELKSGSEINMIGENIIDELGLEIAIGEQAMYDVYEMDRVNIKYDVVGYSYFSLVSSGVKMEYLGIVVGEDVGIVAGSPFMEDNDIMVRPSRHQIIFSNNAIFEYDENEQCSVVHESRLVPVTRVTEQNLPVESLDALYDEPCSSGRKPILSDSPESEEVKPSHIHSGSAGNSRCHGDNHLTSGNSVESSSISFRATHTGSCDDLSGQNNICPTLGNNDESDPLTSDPCTTSCNNTALENVNISVSVNNLRMTDSHESNVTRSIIPRNDSHVLCTEMCSPVPRDEMRLLVSCDNLQIDVGSVNATTQQQLSHTVTHTTSGINQSQATTSLTTSHTEPNSYPGLEHQHTLTQSHLHAINIADSHTSAHHQLATFNVCDNDINTHQPPSDIDANTNYQDVPPLTDVDAHTNYLDVPPFTDVDAYTNYLDVPPPTDVVALRYQPPADVDAPTNYLDFSFCSDVDASPDPQPPVDGSVPSNKFPSTIDVPIPLLTRAPDTHDPFCPYVVSPISHATLGRSNLSYHVIVSYSTIANDVLAFQPLGPRGAATYPTTLGPNFPSWSDAFWIWSGSFSTADNHPPESCTLNSSPHSWPHSPLMHALLSHLSFKPP
ncbi:uncharacterized protein LOC121408592 [Lytechinus variegatus]|uniref:uncharacterized protein LOC121408592 n=1 Tax=Lytechinus variegatus TaxID=7654 RepID=UPI001BB0FA38|nr:uncharacterized protein LOC121408592 [Lytechinus variegatus]